MDSMDEKKMNANELIEKFDSGELSRRDLIKAAVATGLLPMAASRALGSPSIAPLALQSIIGEAGADYRWPGRKVLLERLLNHKYEFKSNILTGNVQSASGTLITITSNAHGIQDGSWVNITGVQGNTAANGKWRIRVLDANRFLLLNSASNATHVPNTGNWTSRENKAYLRGLEGAVDAATATLGQPIVITSANHGLVTGDQIVVSGVRGATEANNTAANPSWTINKIDANNVQLAGSAGAGNTHVPNTGSWREYEQHNVFDNSKEHQEWLFAEGGYSGTGLKVYSSSVGGSRSAITQPIRGHNPGSDDLEDGAPDPGPAALEATRTQADKGKLNVFQVGSSVLNVGDKYEYDDLYGLVRMKLEWICEHCSTDVGIQLFQWLLGTQYLKPGEEGKSVTDLHGDTVANLRKVKVTPDANGEVTIREVLMSLFDDGGATWGQLMAELPDAQVNWSLMLAGLNESHMEGDAVSSHGDY